MNNESAFAPSESLKGEPAKAIEVKIEMISRFKYRLKVPFRGFQPAGR
jgi:hypothetical protein